MDEFQPLMAVGAVVRLQIAYADMMETITGQIASISPYGVDIYEYQGPDTSPRLAFVPWHVITKAHGMQL